MVSKSSPSRRGLLALGVALVALLAFGASVAAAAPPVNKELPVVSPSTPYLGSVEATTDGVWSGEIGFGFTYAWQRCNAEGLSCVTIPGATGKTYTAAMGDAGHKLVSAVTAKNVYGSTTAYSKPTNLFQPLGPQYWYACAEKGAEFKVRYSDSACTVETTGWEYYSWNKLTSPTSITMTGSTPFTWAFMTGGLEVAVTCSAQTSTKGTAQNPKEGTGSGTAEITLSFSGCVLNKPIEGCTGRVETTQPMTGQLVDFKGKSAVQFKSTGWQEYASIVHFEGKCPYLHDNYLKGTFTGVSDAATSSLVFTKDSSSMFAGGGNGGQAWVAGTSKVATSTGQALKVGL